MMLSLVNTLPQNVFSFMTFSANPNTQIAPNPKLIDQYTEQLNEADSKFKKRTSNTYKCTRKNTKTTRKNPNLLVLEARADVSKLLVDAEALLLFVLAIADVADEDREPSHAGQRHLRSDPLSLTQTRADRER